MGRGGVTLSEVEQAALYLQDKGRAPTVDGVREYLGTGSRTTLAAHLKKWKDAQQDGTGHIPKQLASVVAGLWDQLQEQANSRIAALQAKFDAEMVEIRKELVVAKGDTMKQETLFVETRQQLDATRSEVTELTKKLQEAGQSCERLAILNETASKQLDDTKAENQRLHDLSRQIQRNLEHYQEAIHRQKTEDSLRQEKQQATFRQEISTLEQTLADTARRLTAAEKDASLHAQEATARQAEFVSLRERHDLLAKEYREKENQFLQFTTRHDLLLEQHDSLKQSLAETQMLLQVSKQQEAVLDSRLKNSEAAFLKAEDRIASLQHEILFIRQKKNQEKQLVSNRMEEKTLEDHIT